jgi:hypothetical protein
MIKPRIKIPKLVPKEIIEIEGNKIELNGYKPYDYPLVLSIEAIHKENLRPLLKKVGEMEREIQDIAVDKEGNTIPDEELKKNGKYDRIIDISDEILISMDKLKEIEDVLIYGNDEDVSMDEMKGPASILTQRGLKRFYYSQDMEPQELDAIPDIEIGRKYIIPITNTIIELSKPPLGLEYSIKAKEESNRATDKGKSLKKGKTSPSKKKPMTSEK